MTDSRRTILNRGPVALAARNFDSPAAGSHHPAFSPTQPAKRTIDQYTQSAKGAARTNVLFDPNVNDLDDHVIRSLSSALETVELEHDIRCAEALRRAITVRLVGLQSETRVVNSPRSDPHGRQIRALQKWRLKRVMDYVDEHLSSRLTLLDLAEVAGLSRMHFASQFRAATGLRPHEFLLKRRIQRSEELLRDSGMTIAEIAVNVGFQTQAHFTTVFKRFVGFTPRQWRTANQFLGIQRDAKWSEPPADGFALRS